MSTFYTVLLIGFLILVVFNTGVIFLFGGYFREEYQSVTLRNSLLTAVLVSFSWVMLIPIQILPLVGLLYIVAWFPLARFCIEFALDFTRRQANMLTLIFLVMNLGGIFGLIQVTAQVAPAIQETVARRQQGGITREEYHRQIEQQLAIQCAGDANFMVIWDSEYDEWNYALKTLDGRRLLLADGLSGYDQGINPAQAVASLRNSLQVSLEEQVRSPEGITSVFTGRFGTRPQAARIVEFYEKMAPRPLDLPATATLLVEPASYDILSLDRLTSHSWDLTLTADDLAPLGGRLLEDKSVDREADAEYVDSSSWHYFQTPYGEVETAVWVFRSEGAAREDFYTDRWNLPYRNDDEVALLLPADATGFRPDQFVALIYRPVPNGGELPWLRVQRQVGHVGFQLTYPHVARDDASARFAALIDDQETRIRKAIGRR